MLSHFLFTIMSVKNEFVMVGWRVGMGKWRENFWNRHLARTSEI